MFDRLVVEFDGSQPSVAPLRWAADEAHLRRARSTRSRASSCRCCSPSGRRARFLCSHLGVESMRADTEADLGRVLADVARSHPDVASESNVVDGHTLDVLGHESERSDMVVVGVTGCAVRRGATSRLDSPRPRANLRVPLVLVPGTDRHHKTDRIVVGTTDPSIRTQRPTGPSTKPTAAAQSSSSSMPGRIPTARRSSRRPRCMTAPESTRASRSAQQSNAARNEPG